MMRIKDYQLEAVNKLKNGNILKGGTGSGKSFTSLYYYYVKVCGGEFEPDLKPMTNPRPLYIITTPKKRDSLEWESDMAPFLLSSKTECQVSVTVDSWNNIKKYINVSGAFFILDENRIIGSGAWVKAFYKIVRRNQWILLTATPGDTWSDYIPVFVANGFYRNKTDFKEQHIIMNPFTRYPSIKGYFNQGKLQKYRKQITVEMNAPEVAVLLHQDIRCDYDKKTEREVLRHRWHPFEDRPLRDATEMAVVMRKIAFGDISRIEKVKELHEVNPKIIIFYDYNFELDMLINMCETEGYSYAQWNGHKHEPIPDTEEWLYLCQYTSASEAWNCITTDCMIFFNNSYSWKKMEQAVGRIKRLNTPFKELHYYHLTSGSYIDKRINQSLNIKGEFNDMREFRRYFE